MPMRRLRPVTNPRISTHPTNPTNPANPAANPVNDVDGAETLAHWLAATHRARADTTGRRIWQITDSPEFAELWYEARDAGERARARAVAALYANWSHPGGRYPDPREPAAFSERAILTKAANICKMRVWQRPVPSAPLTEMGARIAGQPEEPIVWLMTFPPDQDGKPVQPTLALHEATLAIPEARILFEMACMLGYLTKAQLHMLDPNAPHGVTLLPRDPSLVSLTHQFAIALLCLDPCCPEEWSCQCNLVRKRYNAPPPEHEQPTDTLNVADLRRAIPRTDPHR